MLIPFGKIQAQGNDFVVLQLLHTRETSLPPDALARDICDRRTGVGADGLVLLLAEAGADARMVIHNSDGSHALMCGSALRCCASLLHRLTGKTELRIATASGLKNASVRERQISVNLGKPVLQEQDLDLEGVTGTVVEVGNLHFVSFQARLHGQELETGPRLERHPRFREGVNAEFARVVSRLEIEMKVWERGAGATQACGTGAVASVFSGINKGLLDNEVWVKMPGGAVHVARLENGEFMLAGTVEHTFSGVYQWKI